MSEHLLFAGREILDVGVIGMMSHTLLAVPKHTLVWVIDDSAS